jgi:hypothetical protein
MATDDRNGPKGSTSSNRPLLLAFAWLAVGVPLLWGVVETVKKALPLFR